MPDPGEPHQPFQQDYEALVESLRTTELRLDLAPQEQDFLRYADYLDAVRAYVRELVEQPGGELEIRRQAIMLQVKVEQLLREAAGP